MAFQPKLAVFLLLAGLAALAGARELEVPAAVLEARLAAGLGGNDGGLVNCWNALLELKSCTDEVVLFFVNGESYLGLECCRAIRVITRHCWPAMLTSIGFTAQEGDILRGYCDAETADAPAAAPPPPHQHPAASPAA